MMLRERSVREHALWTVGILVFLGCGAFAQGIVLEPTPESVSVEPPSLVTLGFRITNETAVDEGLRAEVTVPTDWRVVASLPSVDLPAGGTDVLLALIRVPQGTPAGEYPVEFRVRRTSDGVVLAEASVSVHVTDAFGLTVQAIDDTANVLAGQLATYEVTVTNVGNATCWFSVDVAAEWPADAAPSSGTLPPNGAAAVAVFHEVPVGIDAGSTDWLHITVRGSDGAEDSVTLKTRVAPPAGLSASSSLFENVPTTVVYAMEHDVLDRTLWTSVSLSSFARIGDGRFLAAGTVRSLIPSESPTLTSGLLSYRTPRISFALGDTTVSWGSLLRLSLRGAAGSYDSEWVRVSGSAGLEGEQACAGGELAFGPSWLYVASAYMERRSATDHEQGWAVRAHAAPLPGLCLDLDGGLGVENGYRGHAASFAAVYEGTNTRSSLEVFSVGPWFPGVRQDVAGVLVRERVRLWTFDGSASYKHTRDNVLDLPSVTPSFCDRLDVALTFHPTAPAPGMTVGGSWAWERDRDLAANDESVVAVFGGLSGALGAISYALHGEVSDESNSITGSSMRDTSFSERFVAVVEGIRISLHLAQASSTDRNTGMTLGGSAEASVGLAVDGAPCTLDLSTSTEDESWTCDASVGVRLSEVLGGSMGVSWDWVRGDPDSFGFCWTAAWRWSFDVPVPFLVTRGQVEGVAFLDTDGDGVQDSAEEGLAGVLLVLGSTEALSDASGRFRFPSGSPGDESVALVSFPPETVPLGAFPLAVRLVAGQVTYVSLAFGTAAVVEGRIALRASEEAHERPAVVGDGVEKDGPIAGASVILAGPGGEFSRKTDALGWFRFDRLPPGEWVLRVDPTTVGEYRELVNESVALSLQPGETRSVEIDVVSVERPLRLIDEGTVELAP